MHTGENPARTFEYRLRLWHLSEGVILPPENLPHFLPEYNRRTGVNHVVRVFKDEDGSDALRARFESER